MTYFKLSITFLDGTYHGVLDGGEAEWPPSPMRVYQALVATAGRKFGETFPDEVTNALDWLAGLSSPVIHSPPYRRAMPVRTSVPNNAMDICARAWVRGSYDAKDAKPSTHKAMKTIAPVRLLADSPEQQRVCYVWQLADAPDEANHCEVISSLAQQLVCVGWGIDLVAGHAEIISDAASVVSGNGSTSECWTAGRQNARRLRSPNKNTLSALRQRHQRFVRRLVGDSLAAVPAIPPSAFDVVGYARDWESTGHSIAAFSLIKEDGSGFAQFPARKGVELVGMVRRAIASAAKTAGWNDWKIAAVVLGHAEDQGQEHQSVGLDRFAYVPLPSLERRSTGPADHAGLVRRLLIYCPSGKLTDEISWARRALAGLLLNEEASGKPLAMLSTIPASDNVVRRYTDAFQSSGTSTWSTVTPMVLPRNYMRRQDVSRLKSAKDAATKKRLYEQRGDKIDAIIRMAIVQAGFSETLARHASITHRKVSFWPGAPSSRDIFVPNHLRKFPTLHVRLTWRDPHGNPLPMCGPIVIGGGRFFGLGLFAGEREMHQPREEMVEKLR